VRLPVFANRWDDLADRVPEPLPLVSVIVAHYEQPRQLERTLLALARQDYPAELIEIIVVDDGSRVPPLVEAGITLVVQPDEGFRLAAARNAGARVARGSVLLFLDADTSPEPSYVRLLSRLPAIAPDCVTVGRRRHAQLDDSGRPVEEVGPAHELAEPPWLIDAYARSRDLLDADDRSYRFIIGAVVACSREMFDLTGGFDETFTSYGGEDWEWAYRAWLLGAVFAHERRAVAWHDGPEVTGRAEHDLRREKNREAIRLSDLVTVPGSGRRGLPSSRPDVVVSADALTGSEAAEFVTVDSVLADVPTAAVVGGRFATHDRNGWANARIRVHLHGPVQVTGAALRDAVAEVGESGLGSLTLTDADDEPIVTVSAARAEARERRWGEQLFPSRRRAEPRLRPLTEEPDVEAYLGEWAERPVRGQPT